MAQINKYERKEIRESILETFNELNQMWKEELYFEMYDFGQTKSKRILSKAEFAQRMVSLKWKPALTEIKLETVQIIYRNFAAVHCIIEFENKVNLTQKVIKRMIFPTILEERKWKFDLLQIIRIPFSGKQYAPDKSTEKEKVKTTIGKAAPPPNPEPGTSPSEKPL